MESHQHLTTTTTTTTGRVPLRDSTNDLFHSKRQKLSSAQQQHAIKQANTQAPEVIPITQKRRPVLEGEEFKEWQAIWRRTMKESVIYFYGDDGNNHQYRLETEKAKLALRQLGARISPFFDSDVTIIISRKPYDKKMAYRQGHVFHSASANGLKVWTYEKVFRFLKNLGEPAPQLTKKNHQNQNLSVLLTQERLHGPIDRDPSARRDDFHYLKGLYFYCFDLRQVYRPVAVREWPCAKGQDEENALFPQLYASTNGRCPFQDDPINDNSTKKRLQRLKFFEENKFFRQKLIKASVIKKKRSYLEMNDSDSEVDDSFYKSSSSSSSSAKSSPSSAQSDSHSCSSSPSHSQSLSDSIEQQEQEQEHQEGEEEEEDNQLLSESQQGEESSHHLNTSHGTQTTSRSLMAAPPAPVRDDDSNFRSNYPISNQNVKFFEIQASGMNNQSTAISNQSQQDFGNNGLAPSKAEVLTKTFKSLNRKVTKANKSASLKEVIDLKQKREAEKTNAANEKQAKEKTATKPTVTTAEMKTAGYCESCRLKYDDFDLHIISTKHRSFALKDSNFEQIDDLIKKIHDTNILHSHKL